MIMTGVSGHFSAAHRVRPDAEHFHGHTWTVRAWVCAEGYDAVALKRDLEDVLADLDHSELPDDLSRGEDIAVHVGRMLRGCVEVEVGRTHEGIFARWRA